MCRLQDATKDCHHVRHVRDAFQREREGQKARANSQIDTLVISRWRSTGRNGIIECKLPKRDRLSGDTKLRYSWELFPGGIARARARRGRGISSRRYEYFSRPGEIFRLLRIAPSFGRCTVNCEYRDRVNGERNGSKQKVART